ncbi:V-set and immunoglobulin domain-containing protein 10-like 2 [Trichomycterus rosablanca]|uniref:V-set and immunoglobulin domain-containing protein 10-like 2 n=1 Tax=Trichomycterus rosablanca TaxID=2290929 RepID=UPI002F360171
MVSQKVADDLDPGTHSYHIANLDPSVRYAFRVTAVNRRTFGNPSDIMSPVGLPVSKPYILLSDTSPEEGTSVWMSCGLGNGTEPIHYIWELKRHDGLVTILAEHNSSLYTITRVSRNHTGWYRCLAKNEINQQGSDQIWLDVLYGPDLPQIDATAYTATENVFSVLENRNISLLCRAFSNPPSQYVWFFNNSQIYTGPQITITKIQRMQAGDYTCLTKNTHLNTHSERTTTLTVYYPPDRIPSCTMFPANNYTDLKLFCSWEGGYPPASLKWTSLNGVNREGFAEVSQVQPGPGTANNSVFTCYGSHVALNLNQSCNTRAWLPHGEPTCVANSSLNNEHLVLSCSWVRGFPQALLWWTSGLGDMLSVSEEETNILVLHSNNSYNGKSFVCHSKHPLAVESKKCVLKLAQLGIGH